MRPIDVVLLGSTGSIGTQALDVVEALPERFRVVGLAAGRNADRVIAQAKAHAVSHVAVADRAAARQVAEALGEDADVLDGEDGVAELATRPADVVLNGINGAVGLRSTLAALDTGTPVALANKESLIVGGDLVLDAAVRAQARAGAAPGDGPSPPLGGLRTPWLLPVDSEHSALAQTLRGTRHEEIARLLVTASGGPFRGWSRPALAEVTAADALRHPTWAMGAVITVNSASLANKGMEVIEAHLLFGVDFDHIDVVVHPQSIVHGMVELIDGATIAKLSPPDMRLPIQLALGHPARLPHAPARIDWAQASRLDFEPVDTAAFPMLELAVDAGRAGGTAPAVFNAANEVAVAAFLDGQVGFLGIDGTVAAVLEVHEAAAAADVDTVLAADAWARARARERLTAER